MPTQTARQLSVSVGGSYQVAGLLGGQTSPLSPAVPVSVVPLPAKPTVTANGSVLQASSSTGNEWLLNGSPIAGATAATFEAKLSGTYTVRTTVNGCSATSDGFVFTVAPVVAPSLTAANGGNFCAGSTLLLTAATGYDSYQWYRDGAVVPTQTARQLSVSVGGSYQVAGLLGGQTSPLSPAVPVSVVPLPAKPTITANGSVLQASSSTGNEWLLNGSPIAGATAATFEAKLSGTYTVRTTVNGCSATSDGFVFTVAPVVAPSLTAANGGNFCAGSTLLLTAATGYDSYQWYRDGAVVPTQTARQLSVSVGGSYQVAGLLGGQTSPLSPAVPVSVVPLPAKPTITANGSVLQASSSTGNEWLLNGSPIAGATAATFEAKLSGTYTVRTTVNGCSATSDGFVFSITAQPLSAKSFRLYPNPSQGLLRFDWPETAEAYLTVTDALGRLLHRETRQLTANAPTELVLTGLKSGLYLLQVRTDQRMATGKVLIEP